jgi:hypothetical protein
LTPYKQRQLRKAEKVGLAYARDLFERFKGPDMRGPNFTWEEFPSMLRSLVEASACTAFPFKIGRDIERHAGESAYQEARRLVVEAGLASVSVA